MNVCHFSVVLSLYHADDPVQFKEAALSILNQTVQPSEIIVAVDGGLEPALESALADVSQEPIVRVLRLPVNLGLGGSRHAAISAAHYDIIAVMDADDIAVPDRFAAQLDALEYSSVDVVGGFIEEFDKQPGDTHRVRVVPTHHDDIIRYGRWRQPVNHVTIMFRRKAYEMVGGYQAIRGVEDYDLFHRMFVSGVRFANVPRVLVMVRCGTALLSRRRGTRYLRAEIALLGRMRASSFLTRWQYLTNMVIRLVFRMLPRPLLRLLYQGPLRAHQFGKTRTTT